MKKGWIRTRLGSITLSAAIIAAGIFGAFTSSEVIRDLRAVNETQRPGNDLTDEVSRESSESIGSQISVAEQSDSYNTSSEPADFQEPEKGDWNESTLNSTSYDFDTETITVMPDQSPAEKGPESLENQQSEDLPKNDQSSDLANLSSTNILSSPTDDVFITVVNGNVPDFTGLDISNLSIRYSELDSIGRCGSAVALITPDILPAEPRGSIGMIKPSGWHTVRYDFIDGKYLYNRCHLIAYQLGGVGANPQNLITGTRYLNTEGMLSFETSVADYVRYYGNSVLYRATPVFTGDNLVADGVHLEALSVEDGGKGICFNVFIRNMQPGVIIDYSTGESTSENDTVRSSEDAVAATEQEPSEDIVDKVEITYVLNKNTKRFHYPNCRSVDDMSAKNREDYYGDRESLIEMGYIPCGNCKP